MIRISLAFAQSPDPDLDEFATNVILKMSGNAAFASPPIPMSTLSTQQLAFHFDLSNMTQGGTQATALKIAARTALLTTLRTLAAYIESIPGITEATALTSGFKIIAQNRTPVTVVAPVISGVVNAGTGQLLVSLNPVNGAKGYEVEVSSQPGVWVRGGLFSSTRNMVVSGLTPGTMYALRARTLGPNNQLSNWSDSVSHMAI